ncbi:MAG TPA: hypothetical protein VGG39_11580 [Polyangiaceae bacterium]|jgi:hypothetical protein
MHRLVSAWVLGVGLALGFVACGGGSSGSAGPGGADASTDAPSKSDAGPPAEAAADGTSSGDATSDAAADAPTDAPSDTASDDAGDGAFAPASHPAWPIVLPNAGVVLKNMKLVTIVASTDPNANDLFAFDDGLVQSQWWSAFSTEYGLGTPSASIHVTGAAVTGNPTEGTMEAYIAASIAADADGGAGPDGNTMYMLYLPPGIDIIDARGENTNCQYYGGYHAQYDKSGDAWGVVQHCPVANTGITDLQSMTIIGSHEIAEGATDPIPGNGYTAGSPLTSQPWTQSPLVQTLFGEVGDLCSDTQWTEGAYTYQRIWSIAAAAKGFDPCVPAYPNQAYYNASPANLWYAVKAGTGLKIPVVGWSDRPTANWLIGPEVWTQSVTGFAAAYSSSLIEKTDAGSYYATNDGQTSYLQVDAPADATSGAWATVALFNFTPGEPGDPYHIWFVGVYVP